MDRLTLNAFLSGAMVAGYLVAGLLFLRFWSRTRDRLFVIFALAFWLLGLQRLLLAGDPRAAEDQIEHYFLRLLAYVLILVALYDKNRKGRPGLKGAAESGS